MRNFDFKTAKGASVNITDDGEYVKLSVGNHIDINVIEVTNNGSLELRGKNGDTNIVVPVPAQVLPKFRAWQAEGAEPMSYTIECESCGNIKYNAQPGEQYCHICDGHENHRII